MCVYVCVMYTYSRHIGQTTNTHTNVTRASPGTASAFGDAAENPALCATHSEVRVRAVL